MSAETETKPAEGEEYVKPNPASNPRNIALAEIAAAVDAKHQVEFAETMPSIDDEGRILPPEGGEPEGAAPQVPAAEPATPPSAEQPSLPAAPPAEASGLNPDQMYKVVVDGQEIEVPGRAIIDAGMRTFQKETAADYRLKLASQLLQEAEAKAKGAAISPETPAALPEPQGQDDAALAQALQFGTPEQAAAALKELRGRPSVSPEEIARIVDARSRNVAQDEIQFQEAKKFVQAEYSDLMSNDYLRRLFFLEENRRRAPKERGGEGDKRPYKDLYTAIGNDLRKSFNLQKPAAAVGSPSSGTAQARQARKADTPPVPRTAATRLQEASGAAKVSTPSEIIAGMAARRGHDRLFQPDKRS